MGATTTSVGGIAVVSPHGRVDSLSAGRLMVALQDAMTADSPRLVVDMSKVDYIGSKGLQALLTALTECRHAGGDLKLAGVSANIHHVLSIIQFDRLFSICACVESAVADFVAQPK